MIANSGRFSNTLSEILGENPFDNFMALSDWLFETTGQTHKLALPRLFKLIYQHYNSSEPIKISLEQDFNKTGIKSLFSSVTGNIQQNKKTTQAASSRQNRHLS